MLSESEVKAAVQWIIDGQQPEPRSWTSFNILTGCVIFLFSKWRIKYDLHHK